MNQLPTLPAIDFYKLLEVEPTANDEAIKRAYRKMALKYHPDKNSGDPEAAEKFQMISKANSTLLDPKKRQIYDKYGSRGIQMIEQMGEMAPFIDPEMILAMNQLFFFATLLVGLMIMFPAFVSIRADDIVSWRWAVVFIPAFIIDALLLFIISRMTIPSLHTQNGDADSSQTHENDNASTSNQNEISAARKFITKLALLFYVSLFVLFQILIALRLDFTITWEWKNIFFPWYIMEITHFIITTFSLLTKIRMGKMDFVPDDQEGAPVPTPYTTSELGMLVLDGYSAWIFRIIQMVLFILKLDGVLNTSWAVVFIPFYISGLYKLLVLLNQYYSVKKISRTNPELRVQSPVVVLIVLYLISAGLFYLGLGLLISRLDGESSTPSTAVILIPVFIILSLLFCCCCCCLPCMARQARSAVEQEMMRSDDIGMNGTIQQVVSTDRRLM